MIGKQTKGKSFRGLLNYLENKQDSYLIGGNMFGRNAAELACEFRVSQQLNSSAEKVVHHVSLSLAFGERLDDSSWCALAGEYMEAMGYTANQYAVYRHDDTEHEHIHICASRIRLDDGLITRDSWEYLRSEEVIRRLEDEYGLQHAPSSRDRKKRRVSSGQLKRVEKERACYELGETQVPPSIPVKVKLQEAIDSSTRDKPSLPRLIARLQVQGIEVRAGFTRTGKSKGISYCMDDVAFSGSKLGAAYTFNGLQKHRGVDYESTRDDERIKELIANPNLAMEMFRRAMEQQRLRIHQQRDKGGFER